MLCIHCSNPDAKPICENEDAATCKNKIVGIDCDCAECNQDQYCFKSPLCIDCLKNRKIFYQYYYYDPCIIYCHDCIADFKLKFPKNIFPPQTA